MPAQRIEWIDRMKGILILLVVLGHVVGMGSHYSVGLEHDVLAFLYKFIYLFHMPAFFFVAGLTYKEMTITEFIRKRSFRLLMPYFSFGVISIVIYQLLIGRFMASESSVGYYNVIATTWQASWWHPWVSLLYGAPLPGTDGFRCNSVLWFLPCYLMVQLVFVLTSRFGKWFELGVGLVSVPLYVLFVRLHVPELPWGISLVFRFLPFVIAGHLLSPVLKLTDRRIDVGLIVAFALFVLLVPLAPYQWSMYSSYWQWPIIVLYGILGTIGAVALSKYAIWKGAVWFGGASMGIMMVHKWFVVGLFKCLPLNTIIVFVLTVVFSGLTVWFVRKICPEMLGERRRT